MRSSIVSVTPSWSDNQVAADESASEASAEHVATYVNGVECREGGCLRQGRGLPR
jgi:hypothetical protein